MIITRCLRWMAQARGLARGSARVASLLPSALLVALSVARGAAGGEPDRAEALFQRARALMEKNDFAAACPMLEEAYSLDHGEGTLLAMALCHEASGRPATALREYRESLSLAVRANRSDRVMLAESHVQTLEASVSRITLRFASAAPTALSLTLDGAPIDRATMLAGAPVDPGTHAIAATAPSYLPWRTNVVVTKRSGSVVVDVPELASAEPRVGAPRAPTSARASGSRILGFTLGGLGLASLGVGTYFGIAAFAAEARSRDQCNGTQCSADGVTYNHQARGDALVADVALAAGGVALAASLYLLLRPSPGASAATLNIWTGERRAGIGIVTSW
jgi:hypothetical protein